MEMDFVNGFHFGIMLNNDGFIISNFHYEFLKININTEAKWCFATHDEDIDYFNMRIYIILIACVYIQQFNFIQ